MLFAKRAEQNLPLRGAVDEVVTFFTIHAAQKALAMGSYMGKGQPTSDLSISPGGLDAAARDHAG